MGKNRIATTVKRYRQHRRTYRQSSSITIGSNGIDALSYMNHNVRNKWNMKAKKRRYDPTMKGNNKKQQVETIYWSRIEPTSVNDINMKMQTITLVEESSY